MGFSRQEYWGQLPFPSPGDFPDLEIEPCFPALQADSLLSAPPGKLKLAQMSESLQAGRQQILRMFRSSEPSRIVPLKSQKLQGDLEAYAEGVRLVGKTMIRGETGDIHFP